MQVIETTEHHVIVLKPAGVACELPFNPEGDSVLRRLALQGFDGLRLVHRLDAPTSGLLLMARSLEAAVYYSQEIASRHWHKWYIARVDAALAQASKLLGVHKAYLKTEGRLARVVRAGGKPSSLEITDAVAAPSGRGTDLLIRLHSGRFHQIRVMLSHLGAPLSGDRKYGGRETGTMYLEHVMLAARAHLALEWKVWVAPEHDDRPPLNVALEHALLQQRETFVRTLEEPAR